LEADKQREGNGGRRIDTTKARRHKEEKERESIKGLIPFCLGVLVVILMEKIDTTNPRRHKEEKERST